MKHITVNPNELKKSELNERDSQQVTEESDLYKNLEKGSLNDYPIVHEEEEGYGVVVGWRRVLAFRLLGRDEIPVRVDEEATEYQLRMKSITDNIRSFSQDTPIQDRAKAIKLAKEEGNKSNADIATDLGKGRTTIVDWLEPYNWGKGTFVHPENESKKPSHWQRFSHRTLGAVRKAVGGDEVYGVKALEYITEYDLSSTDVRQAKSDTDSKKGFFDALYEHACVRHEEDTVDEAGVSWSDEEKQSTKESGNKPEKTTVEESEPEEPETTTIEVSRESAETLESVAESSGSSPREVMDTVVSGTKEPEIEEEEPQAVVATEIDKEEPGEVSLESNGEKTRDELDQRRTAINNHEGKIKLSDLKDNWDAYGHAINHISRAKCPEEGCDNGIEHLTWDCHGHDVGESYLMAQEVYEQAIADSPSTKEMLEDMDGYDGYEYDEEYEEARDYTKEEEQ